ncbi:hypothetical protein [Chryseobacterium koreense]|uniref:DUF4595 domain-containing protein n=1 Tax=Chryseobacterium koreense CCUG 49689 TaxID=1304281 RepID=A0A0J7LTT4_9FLAO|nr:hypothetical protein [Chryseobacterium koreense]KMQ72345.1 hypothetical protein ACM44_02580 [Chryseobacterium koreense CCUG 49689]MBB5333958.1 hypothetical protein [Chryseobacterium koreense]
MKKILPLFLASSLIISCSRTNDEVTPPEDTTPVLVTKINFLEADGTTAGSMNFTYSGDKIVKAESSDGSEKIEYTYTGDDLSKSVEYINSKINSISEFSYTNGKLTSQKVIESYSPHTYTYTINYEYVNDNYVKYSRIIGYTTSPGGVITYNSANYDAFLSNGKLNKLVSTSSSSGTTTYTYTYDDKNSPYRNIKGFTKAMLFDSSDAEINQSNLTKRNSSQVIGTSTYTNSSTMNYTYNANNYPTKSTTSFTSSSSPSITYSQTFEYNK